MAVGSRQIATRIIPVDAGSIYSNEDTLGNITTWLDGITEHIVETELAYSGTAGSYAAVVITHPRN